MDWNRIITSYNRNYKRLVVQWLNKVSCCLSSSVMVKILVLLNRQLIVSTARYIYLLIIIGIGFLSLAAVSISKTQNIEYESRNYTSGETLNYRLHYGFIDAGFASVTIDPKLTFVDDRPCYNVAVFGKTVGTADLMFKVRDTWRSYMDTASQAPLKSFRNIHEGKYKLKEEVLYDYKMNIAKVYRKHPDRVGEEFEYKVPSNVQDIVSGFYQTRRINFAKLKLGDTITIKAFFDKENINFKVRYLGKGVVNTDAGKFRALKLIPVMPKNKLFDGEESIKLWISDDKNKILLLAQVEFFVGSVKLELTSYKGLLNEISVN